jgi:hypothetical protein
VSLEKLLPSPNEQPDPPPSETGDLLITPEAEVAWRRLGELDNTPLEEYAETRQFANANDLFTFLQTWPLACQSWAFRGQADEQWRLEPSLERLARRYKDIRADAETYAVRAFKRRAHHYLRDLPGEQDDLEWLALMRHHGAPTRLLDWTRSPYVAAFFATAEANEKDNSAIWAVDIEAIRHEAREMLVESSSMGRPSGEGYSFSQRDVFNTVVMGKTHPTIVVPVQPFKTNERMTSQQGLFLCANCLSFPGFEIGLKQVLDSSRNRNRALWLAEFPDKVPNDSSFLRLFKLLISPSARRDVLKELHRMNINYATLFPGLDGFAQSLRTILTTDRTMDDCVGHGVIDSEI